MGQTLGEVVETVGGPPGDYSDGTAMSNWLICRGRYERWLAHDGELVVFLGPDDRVTEVLVDDADVMPPPTLVERVHIWLGV